MPRISTLLLLSSLAISTAALAEEEFSGTLVDANCTHRNGGPHACDAGPNTTAFGLVIAGRAYAFDTKGSQKASAVMKQRERLHDADPHYPYFNPATASVTGQRAGKKILVRRINIIE
jgi:hypothetical protein